MSIQKIVKMYFLAFSLLISCCSENEFYEDFCDLDSESYEYTEINDSEIVEEPCIEIFKNFCVDESEYKMDDRFVWFEMLIATLQCAGIDELTEMVYVRIISDVLPLDNSRCEREVDGCAYRLDGKLEIEIDTSGKVLAHELGHVIEAMYSILDFDSDLDSEKLDELAHRRCGLAVNCGDVIDLAYIYGDRFSDQDWSKARLNDCDWREVF